MKTHRIFFFLLVVWFLPVLGNIEDSSQELRILKLLPDLVYPLAIEPAIPENFVAGSPFGEIDPSQWIYWGPEDVLDKYFRNPKSLDQPILRIKVTTNRSQTGPDSFTGEDDDFKKAKIKIHANEHFKWGEYPVHAIKATILNKVTCMAWIGLNAPGGATLICNLVYPENQRQPRRMDYDLWNTFIKNTRALIDYEFLKAMGFDMSIGKTVYSISRSKIEFLAEKHNATDKIRIAIIPQSEEIDFDVEETSQGLVGAEWNYMKPMVKVKGTATVNDKFDVVAPEIISILIKNVDEFTAVEEGAELIEIASVFGDLLP